MDIYNTLKKIEIIFIYHEQIHYNVYFITFIIIVDNIFYSNEYI